MKDMLYEQKATPIKGFDLHSTFIAHYYLKCNAF